VKSLRINKNQQFLNVLCQLVHKRSFKEAEKKLLDFIEKTVLDSKSSFQANGNKTICQTIYCSFNEFYLNWLKINKLGIKKELNSLISKKHSNYFISHCSKMEEMDDLLFDLINYLDSVIQKNEIVYGLNCYKKNFSD